MISEVNKILQGDCLDQLKNIPSDSIDSIVTDPPYELGFMGKSWDNTGIANNKEMWAECLRVLKPGGHLLAFSGTRTYHRMASAIEDAGFEIRDMIEWVYGSGFPKSLNIGKAVDKMGNKIKELHNFTKWFDELCIEKGLTNKQIDEFLGLDSGGSTASHYRGWNTQQPRYPRENHYKKLKEWLEFSDLWDEKIAEVERELVGVQEKAMSGWNTDGTTKFIDRDITKGNSEWEGWGTALKPAHEPICMARKPLAEKTVAENCLKYRTGGINIDESRVAHQSEADRLSATPQGKVIRNNFAPGEDIEGTETNRPDTSLGRFPANLITDGSEEVRECFPDSKAGSYKGEGSKSGGIWSESTGKPAGMEYGDSGNASRFFKSIIYQAKASKSERNKGCEDLEEKEIRGGGGRAEQGYDDNDPEQQRLKDAAQAYGAVKAKKSNFHPTVKPIALMEYLIKIITPKGGVVLDPFAGSGSTLVAAKQNGFNYIGIEKELEYINIINARLQ